VGDAWMPGAVCLQACYDGGGLRGGAPRVVWQTLETDPRLVSARSAAERLDELGRAPHLVWNPLSGEIAQLVPVLRAGRSLGADGLLGASASIAHDAPPVNGEGRLCVQIAVVSFAAEPFTSGPMTDLELIIWWLDSWRIPRSWPAGPPGPSRRAHGGQRSRRLWARGGHFGGSQVPESGGTGPGAIEVERLTGPAAIPPIEVPRHREAKLPHAERAAGPAAERTARRKAERTAARAASPIHFPRHSQDDAGERLTGAGRTAGG